MSAVKRMSHRGGSIFLLLFGIPFAGAGIGFAWFSLQTYRESVAMKAWDTTTATITHTELKSHRNDKSTSYEVKATYAYTYAGKEFTGDRVGVHKGSDNIGSWQHDTYRLLEENRQSGAPMACYVDPQSPDHAVLFREVRPGLMALMTLLPLLFASIGLGIMGAGAALALKHRRVAVLRSRFADEPWQWRADWALGYCRQRGHGSPWPVAVAAVLWNSLAWGVVVPLMLGGLQATPLLGWLGLIPAAGLGLLGWTAYRFAVRRKYGQPVLRLASMPVERGGMLIGDLPLGGAVRRADTVKVTVQCIRRTVQRHGKNTSISSDTLWEKELRGAYETGCVELRVPIPVNQPETDPPPANTGISWCVNIHADVPGVDYDGVFEIPVFGRAENAVMPEPEATEEGHAPAAPGEDDLASVVRSLQEDGLRIQKHPQGGIRIVTPPFRLKGTAVGLFIFLAIWMGTTVLLFHAPRVPILFKIVWPVTDLLVFWGFLHVLFWSAVTEVRQGRLRVRSGLFRLRVRELTAAEVSSTIATASMQSGNTRYYSVKLVTPQGKITVAGMIKGQYRAAQLRGLVQQALQGEFG